MRAAYDFSPLYRSMIGADHMAGFIESALNGAGGRDRPPYDIEKTGDQTYRVTLATPGFRREDLELTAQPNLLIVRGVKSDGEPARNYLHRGLPQRRFEQRFELADYVVVKDARYADGLLTVELEREAPEALKPRRIEINGPSGGGLAQLIDRKRRKAA